MASGRVENPLRLRNSGSGLGLQEPVSPRALRFPGLTSSWSSGRRMFWALPGTNPRAPLASLLLVPQASSGAQKRSCPRHVHVTLGQPGKAPVRLCLPSPTLPAPPCDGLWTVPPLAPGSLPTPLSGLGRPNQVPSEAHPPTPAPTLWRLPFALWFVGQRAPSSAPLAPGLRCCGQGWAQVPPTAAA